MTLASAHKKDETIEGDKLIEKRESGRDVLNLLNIFLFKGIFLKPMERVFCICILSFDFKYL